MSPIRPSWSPIRPSCLISDEIAFLLLMAVVYFQVRYMMSQYSEKLLANANAYDSKQEELQQANQKALDKIRHQLQVAHAEVSGRLYALEGSTESFEGAVKELVRSEKTLLAAATTQLRAQLESGGLWGRQRRELEGRVEEAKLREAAWEKAASWA
jgi:hypothetical protein